ncbi:hypothetical protein [Alistipes sp.]|uniref:hypothetical protein n=1 Tax=Alistipes sp. TaxID=1872444 RepID=UPI003AB30F63
MKYSFLLSLFLICSYPGFAQSSIENIEKKEIIKTGDITFIRGTLPFTLDYNNQANRWIDAPYLQFRDGTPLGEDDYDEYDLKSVQSTFDQAIRATFTKDEMSNLKNNPPAQMTFYYVVSPEGETIETAFIIPRKSAVLADLPPEKYALLEKNLKKYLRWTVNDFGKRMKFLHAWRIVDFPTMKITYPVFPPTTGVVGSLPAKEETIKLP